MPLRSCVCFCLILVAFQANGQAQKSPGRPLPDFDIRQSAELQTVIELRSRAALNSRRTAINSFQVAEGSRSRVTTNRHGLPKLLSRDGGSLSLPSARPHEEIAKSFLADHSGIFAFQRTDLDRLRLTV